MTEREGIRVFLPPFATDLDRWEVIYIPNKQVIDSHLKKSTGQSARLTEYCLCGVPGTHRLSDQWYCDTCWRSGV